MLSARMRLRIRPAAGGGVGGGSQNAQHRQREVEAGDTTVCVVWSAMEVAWLDSSGVLNR
ncbi:hypothetical protein F8538_07990 [Edwardsiella ictaluri]|uniref:hypothetical protein n=1 Tax=Edwardsiella ictaluri TaxID=67780 RepID=UPI0009BEEEED|nr:hypothetical protein [Edwardsiella ictaluri]ARD38344.1 hypothetical protein B6E78_02030 [Edwardsiella ictaluri]QPW26763.1 hypothetical protein F8538_07990 [Edwardsiella ictaluri]